MNLIQMHCNRHESGITDPNLYTQCILSTKTLIHQYIQEFKSSLDYIFESPHLTL